MVVGNFAETEALARSLVAHEAVAVGIADTDIEADNFADADFDDFAYYFGDYFVGIDNEDRIDYSSAVSWVAGLCGADLIFHASDR